MRLKNRISQKLGVGKIKYAFIVIFFLAFLINSCSGDSEAITQLDNWFSLPIAELTIGELIFILLVIGLTT